MASDLYGSHDTLKIASGQCHVRGLHGDLGPCTNRNSDISLRQCLGVFYAVRDDRDHSSVFLEPFDFVGLVTRLDLGDYAIYAGFFGDQLRRGLRITTQHEQRVPHLAKLCHCFFGVGLCRI